MTDQDRDIMTITIHSKDDKGPLQYISGEQKEKWESMERVVRRLVHNKHLANGNQHLLGMIEILGVVLAMPSE